MTDNIIDKLTTNIIQRNFYEEKPENVAKNLLGKYLVRRINKSYLIGKITEVEAYLSSNDKAAHNYSGKTKRNNSLFMKAGHLYVHSMRQYCLIDIVTESVNIPSSVLIRAIKPILGIDIMKVNRNTDDIKKLTDGPGKVCKALNITREFDGIDITDRNSPIFISMIGDEVHKNIIQKSPRIGISKSTELELRFFID